MTTQLNAAARLRSSVEVMAASLDKLTVNDIAHAYQREFGDVVKISYAKLLNGDDESAAYLMSSKDEETGDFLVNHVILELEGGRPRLVELEPLPQFTGSLMETKAYIDKKCR